ncbi:transporter [Caldimonas sp. KR1-144]|uniref:transporter n=1 Tax=Caldimonas sp. KR1-144 TaxID=3400911 RepID=UPI003BFF58D8
MSLGLGTAAQALEVTAGDYEIYPAGVNIGVLYYQHATRSDLYANGTKVLGNAKLTSDIGIARYIRPIALSETATLDINVIQPFGHLHAKDDVAFLGSRSGAADLILGAPVKFLMDPATRDAFSVGPYLYLPTGTYDRNKPLNLGENRWKFLLQLAYVKHFNPNWALDVVGDVEVNRKNDDFGPAGDTMKQDPRKEIQAHLRYMPSQATAFSVGVGRYWVADQEVNGATVMEGARNTYGRLTVTHFLDQTTQFQAQLGRDLAVDRGGFKESARLNLRLGKIF